MKAHLVKKWEISLTYYLNVACRPRSRWFNSKNRKDAYEKSDERESRLKRLIGDSRKKWSFDFKNDTTLALYLDREEVLTRSIYRCK